MKILVYPIIAVLIALGVFLELGGIFLAIEQDNIFKGIAIFAISITLWLSDVFLIVFILSHVFGLGI